MSFHRSNGSTGNGLTEKFDNYFEKKELPMYKDKPYNYASSRRKSPLAQDRRVIAGVVLILIGILYWLGILSTGSDATSSVQSNTKITWGWLSRSESSVDWESRRQAVKEAFVLSWDGYEKYAWGRPLCDRFIDSHWSLSLRL